MRYIVRRYAINSVLIGDATTVAGWSSVGEDSEDAVDVHSIKRGRITFYPAKKFKEVLIRLHYKKV